MRWQCLCFRVDAGLTLLVQVYTSRSIYPRQPNNIGNVLIV